MTTSAAFMRSLMPVPGHRQRMVDRALGLGEFKPTTLDVALLDLEDGVAVSQRTPRVPSWVKPLPGRRTVEVRCGTCA